MEPELTVEGRMFLSDRMLNISIAEKMKVSSSEKEICFPFFRNGKLVRLKYRSFSDKKKQRFDVVSDSETKIPFWNQFNAPTSPHLFITEGEFDCVALTQLGASNCVSLPNGSGSVEVTFRNNYEYLQQYEVIYICFDMDKSGDEAAKKAMSMLPPSKYRKINFPRKDANDWIMQDSPTPEDFQELVLNAQKVDSKNFLHMKDVDSDFFDEINIGISTGWLKLDRLIGGLRLGEITVISADTGAGKTTFCANLMHNVAVRKAGIWINSYEIHHHTFLRKFASIVLRKPLKLQAFDEESKKSFLNWSKNHECYINIFKDKTDLVTLRKQIELASLAYQAKYILIDHLDYIHAAGSKPTTLENIDDAMREIHTLAMEFQVCIILVVHPRQSSDPMKEITMSDLKGSSSIKQYADNIITLTRLDRVDPAQIGKVKLHVWKNRLLGQEGAVTLHYMKEFDSYVEGF